jgi:glyoxylate/hydroxypyruvate reductase A
VLRYFRRFDEYDTQARAGQWAPLPQYHKEDFTVGVLGMGKLGSAVLEALRRSASRCAAGAARPRTWRACSASRHGRPGRLPARHAVLVCMLPLTPETTNLLNRANMCKLPQGAYLINVARGAPSGEPDLLALIKSGHIAGATLDVFRNEPLPAPHPFWQEPRITITPHISALTCARKRAPDRRENPSARTRRTVADVVDRNQGY